MTDDVYADSKAFVRKMRILVRQRDVRNLQDAVQEMREWMKAHPDDVHVGTALEEFDILAEAALHSQHQSVAKIP